MDYLCAKFDNFGLSHFSFITRTDRHTEADDRYTRATTIGMSNQSIFLFFEAQNNSVQNPPSIPCCGCKGKKGKARYLI